MKKKEKKRSSGRPSMEDIGRRMDQEVNRLITYINDEVVPAVRDRSGNALRIAARELDKFAEYLDSTKPRK